jgi:hypothetical protein
LKYTRRSNVTHKEWIPAINPGQNNGLQTELTENNAVKVSNKLIGDETLSSNPTDEVYKSICDGQVAKISIINAQTHFQIKPIINKKWLKIKGFCLYADLIHGSKFNG